MMIALSKSKKKVCKIALCITVTALLLIWGYQSLLLNKAKSKQTQMVQYIRQLHQVKALYVTSSKEQKDLTHLIKESAEQHHIIIDDLAINALQADITLAESSFSDLVQWLATLQREYGIRIKVLQVTRTKTSDAMQIQALQLLLPLTTEI